MSLVELVSICLSKIKNNVNPKLVNCSLLLAFGYFSLLGGSAFAKSISGKIYFNTLQTEQKYQPVKTKLELISRKRLGIKAKKNKDVISNKTGFFFHEFKSIEDILYNDLPPKTRYYRPGYFDIKHEFDGIVRKYKIPITYDKTDWNNNRNITQLIFLYKTKHWDKGNLWFTLTSREKIDQSREPIILVGGLHNVNKEFGEMEGHLYEKGYQVYELNYPSDQDIRLNAWLFKDALDVVKKISGREKIDVVTHSTGGIIVRTYIQSKGLYQKDFNTYLKDNLIVYYDNDVNRLILLAPPNYGSYQANRVVFEKYYGFFEKFFRGFNPNAPTYKQLCLGNKFLYDLNIDFVVNFEKYESIPILIIAGKKSKIFKGSSKILPESKPGQGDGFVSVCSTFLPNTSRVFVNKNHSTIKGTGIDFDPLTGIKFTSLNYEKYNDVLALIDFFFRFDSILPNDLCKGYNISHGIKRFDGSLILKVNAIDNFALSKDKVVDAKDYFLLEHFKKGTGLSNHTVNTNPDIYKKVRVKLYKDSKDKIYYHFNRDYCIDDLSPDFAVCIPAGEYYLLTYDRKKIDLQTRINRRVDGRDSESRPKLQEFYDYITKEVVKRIEIKHGEFTLEDITDISLEDIKEETKDESLADNVGLVEETIVNEVVTKESIMRNKIREYYSKYSDREKKSICDKYIITLCRKMLKYNEIENRKAKSFIDLVPKYLDFEPMDPWGNYYYFDTGGPEALIGTCGPDGIKKTKDDMNVSFDHWTSVFGKSSNYFK